MEAKSSVVFDVAPWEEDTDMVQLEANIRAIQQDGLHWGASELVPVVGNVKKLKIVAIVVDKLVSVDDLATKIQEDNEDYVQSVDIENFVKI